MPVKRRPRIPPEANGIQVNFCKSPVCSNFGVPAVATRQKDERYKLSASGRGIPVLHCRECGEYPPIKSNEGVSSELQRMLEGIQPAKAACCPTEDCENHDKGVGEGKEYYSAFGKTSGGSQRFKCKACGKTFTVKKPSAGQRVPHKNKIVFSLLMNKTPFNRICEVAELNPKTLYDKIDFLHKQCLAFAAAREQKLLKGYRRDRLYLSVDRQEYTVNWTNRSDKRNTVLTAVGSADNDTGYVFGMHLNYNPSLSVAAIEEAALTAGDQGLPYPFRRHAHLWLHSDYVEAVMRSRKTDEAEDLSDKITSTYNQVEGRQDVEVAEQMDGSKKLPSKGIQTHAEYTLYGHFYFLHELFSGIEKVRFFLDQDSGMRAACLAAFQAEIKNRTCDAFYVRINKELTVDEKRTELAKAKKVFWDAKKADENKGLTDTEITLKLIKEQMAAMAEIGKWKDKWLTHPFPNMSEPQKAICYLTDLGDYDDDHKAWLYNRASMHGIDCFFMQIRRRLSLLERPISTASGTGRKWHGYSAYNPSVVIKILDIFRTFYNYCLEGKDGRTPAVRLGLAKGKVDLESIIYYGC